MKADIVVLNDRRFRSPADNLNPTAKTLGLSYVIVNGRVVLENGNLTEERPGQVLLRDCASEPWARHEFREQR